MGDGSVIRSAVRSRAGESDSEEELCSEEEQEVSLLMLLLLLSLRFREFDRPLPLLLLEDLRLDDDPRDEDKDLRLEADETLDPTDKSFLPDIDAGDLGGRLFEAINFLKECD